MMEKAGLGEVALVFLKLGATAFGGPAAHIALMRHEFVERRRWLSDEEYADMLGLANLVPGPNSTEVAIHIGFRMAGWAGLLVAGSCFILPAFLIVLLIASGIAEFGRNPEVRHAMAGIGAAVIAIIAHAIWGLARSVLKKSFLALLAVSCAVGGFLAVPPLALLFGAGILTGGTAAVSAGARRGEGVKILLALSVSVAAVAVIPWFLSYVPAFNTTPSGASLLVVFLKIGSVLYGSGYVLLAFLRSELVLDRGWLSEAQLLDAVAVGQVTPGPVFTTATFIGYTIGGVPGAIFATVGIFLPAFLFVAISGRFLSSMRENPITSSFLDGINAASIGLIAAVAIELGNSVFRSWESIALATVTLAILLRFKLNSAWLVVASGLVGYLARL